MKIQKYIMVLVLVPLFMGVSYADDNVKKSASSSKSKIVYGSETEDSVIRQSDIDTLIKEGNDKKIISLVGTLYNILNDNEEWVDLETFNEMLKLQTSSGITIKYLDDLGISDKAMNQIKTNDYLVKWLSIDIDWKTSLEELLATTAELEAVTAENKAQWTWEEINAKNRALTNIALWS